MTSLSCVPPSFWAKNFKHLLCTTNWYYNMYVRKNIFGNNLNIPTLIIGKLAMFFKSNGTYVSFSGYIALFDILVWNMVNTVAFDLKHTNLNKTNWEFHKKLFVIVLFVHIIIDYYYLQHIHTHMHVIYINNINLYGLTFRCSFIKNDTFQRVSF